MGCCLFLQVGYSATTTNEFSISACFDHRMICFHIVVPDCATGNFLAWRAPLHYDERKHNLISALIYRTDCSNGVITISSAPSASSPRCFLILVLLLLSLSQLPISAPIHSLKNAFETMQMRTSEQMNVS